MSYVLVSTLLHFGLHIILARTCSYDFGFRSLWSSNYEDMMPACAASFMNIYESSLLASIIFVGVAYFDYIIAF